MHTITLNVNDNAYDKIIYFLTNLKDINILKDEVSSDEIDPTKLAKEHFDYISKDELEEIKDLSKKRNSKNYVSMDKIDWK